MENFIQFCRKLGVHQNLLFESDDLGMKFILMVKYVKNLYLLSLIVPFKSRTVNQFTWIINFHRCTH
jgi:hypothetical protein